MRGKPTVFDDIEESERFQTVLEIAKAFREEFGAGIDAHPGGVGTEAGVVNRAFRAAVRVVLGRVVTAEEDAAAVVTWALRWAAIRRLDQLGVAGDRANRLLYDEAGLGDAWPVYLALAPQAVINDLLGDSASE